MESRQMEAFLHQLLTCVTSYGLTSAVVLQPSIVTRVISNLMSEEQQFYLLNDSMILYCQVQSCVCSCIVWLMEVRVRRTFSFLPSGSFCCQSLVISHNLLLTSSFGRSPRLESQGEELSSTFPSAPRSRQSGHQHLLPLQSPLR